MELREIFSAAGFGVILLSIGSVPAMAGPAETTLLQSYAGSWSGAGLLTGGEQPEDFTCRMQVASGTSAKINYTGRCSLVGINLTVSGTVAYNDSARRYEGIMSSNTSYSGLAIGQQRGSTIVFDFKKTNASQEGQNMSVDSQITLKKDTIIVDFEVSFADSSNKMTTSVPFSRTGG